MPLDNKISNIIGVRIPEWLNRQLKTRSAQNSKEFRDNNNLLYLTNKTAWVRLVSSVNIIDQRDRDYFKNLGVTSTSTAEGMAQEFTLFGGTSLYSNKNYTRFGLGVGGSYGILGNDEIKKYGYRPMPGIVRASIETRGRLGSLREATINFKCWDKDQLDVIDALYFKLGFTMFLEWGQTYYYPSEGDPANPSNYDPNKVRSTEFYSIDPFAGNLTKEDIFIQIAKNSRDSEGNYDAMLGIVTNFNFSYNQEGSYDCQLKIMSLGVLGDSIKVNNPSNLPSILKENITRYNNVLQQIARSKNPPIETPPLQPALTEDQRFQNLLNKSQDRATGVFGLTSNENEPAQNVLLNAGTEGSFLYIKKINKLLPLREDSNVSVSFDRRFLDKIFSDKDINLSYDLYVRTTNNWKEDPGTDFYRTDARVPGFSLEKKYNIKSRKLNEDFKFQIWRRNRPQLSINPIPEESKTSIEQNLISNSFPNPNTGYVFKAKPFADTKNKQKNDVIINKGVYGSGIKSTLGSIFGEDFASENDGLLINEKAFKRVGEIFKSEIYNSQNTFSVVNIEPKLYQDRSALGVTPLINKYIFTVKITMPIKLLGEIEVSGIVDSAFQPLPNRTYTKELNFTIEAYIKFEDTEFIRDIFSDFVQPQLNPQPETTDQNTSTNNDPNPASTKSPLTTLSSLELILRTIQVHSLSEAIIRSGNDLEINRSVTSIPLAGDFVKSVFSQGVFTPIMSDLLNPQNVQIPNNEQYETLNAQDRFKVQALYGFATNLMGNKELVSSFTKVDFEQLLTAFVIPYNVSQEIEMGAPLNHPVYIPFGTLLMVLNHCCTIYDDKGFQTPLVYIDFNPNENFCLSSPKQLSTDPFVCLIPFEGTNADYSEIFYQKVMNEGKTAVLPLSGSTQETPIFTPSSFAVDNSDNISSGLLPFKFSQDTITQGYRGKVMNILLNIDYLMNTIRTFSTKNDENKVFLKPLLEQILIDVGKSLGNMNIFRLSYNDAGNTYQIIDDQIIPTATNETRLDSKLDNNPKLPLFGKTSIAKNLDIKTEISSKLSSMIAISANSNVNSKNSLSSKGDTVGYINTNYVDRYIPNRGELTGSAEASDGDKNAAIQFDASIRAFYNSIAPSKQHVSNAANYYIKQLSNIIGNDPATRAAAMIPVSLNFTTDGVSGFNMGQGFTVPEEMLPYTYSQRIINQQTDYIDRVGFVVVGVSNTIENNVWDTSVKANMIFLKDASVYTTYKYEKQPVRPLPPTNSDTYSDDSFPSNENYSNYPKAESNYSNIKFGTGYLGNPANDRINPNLLVDINTAAKESEVVVTITTGIKGHKIKTASGKTSRHSIGNAIDIAIVDGVPVWNQQKIGAKVEKFISSLIKLGYVRLKKNESETGKNKTILAYGFPDHDNHVHVSNTA